MPALTLLQQRDLLLAERREALRVETLARVRALLLELLPGEEVWLFGSVIKPGAFRENSDVDVALWAEPPGISSYRLRALLEESLGRPVDVVLLSDLRFADTVLREGQRWMP